MQRVTEKKRERRAEKERRGEKASEGGVNVIKKFISAFDHE